MAQFVERARRIIRENKGLFEALEEMDRTGKLRKANYKERYNFTLDEELMNEFRSYCLKNNMKMSTVIEGLIRKYLKEK